MRLISCYIENYGKLSATDFSFDGGITQFCKENGFGKTTLASFIKAMLYGLPSDTARSRFNERRHFYPFGGGKFGGNLTFEAGGRTYRVERFFGKHSDTEDELKVFVGGTPTSEFDKKVLGEALFGLDEGSFARTVFVTPEQIEMCSTGDINAKLNKYIDATDGEVGFEAAVEALEKAAKRLKMRGGKGAIAEQEAQIRELKTRIADRQKQAESLTVKYRESGEIEKSIAALEEEERAASARGLLLQKWKQFDYMCDSAEGKQRELAALTQKYPQGVPSREELLTLSSAAKTQVRLTAQAGAAAFDGAKQAQLNGLSRMFGEGVPAEDELAAVNAQINTLRDGKGELTRLASTALSPRESALKSKFDGRLPAEEDMSRQRSNVEQYKLLQSEIMALSAPALPQPAQKNNALPICLFVAAAIALIAGGVLTALSRLVAGCVCLGLGGAALVGGLVTLFMTGAKAARNTVDLHRAGAQARLAALQDEIRAFLVPYGVYSQEGVVYDFKKFEDDLREYEGLTAREAATAERLEALRAQVEENEKSLTAFFCRYGLEGEAFPELFMQLKAAAAEYLRLQKEKNEALAGGKRLAGELTAARARADGVLEKYAISREDDFEGQVAMLEADCAAISRLGGEIARLKRNAEEFKQDNALSVRPEDTEEDGAPRAPRIKELKDSLALKNREIADVEDSLGELGDLKNALENAEDRLLEYKEKHAVYTAAASALREAEHRLNDKYILPVKDAFCRYSETIERALGERVSMDKDFRITFERGGESRPDGHLSSGQRAVCALCFRLALIDNMFEEEKPFIIMDDPFADLDEEHMQKTAKLLRELAADKQIIYFCCHESRAIK